jgi:lysophospholipase L1-like esterase
MRALLANIALSIGALIICAAVGEATVRWFHLEKQLLFDLDDELYWRFRPTQTGFVWMGNASFRSPDSRINNIGTRGADVRPEKNGVPRVLMLGDSYTFGSGVRDDETFSAVLQGAVGGTAEVVNAGVPGYGIFQEERLLRRLGPLLRPQLVIVTVPTGDILRQPFDTPAQERAYLETERQRKRMRDVSELAAFLYRKYYAVRARFADEGVAVPNEQSATSGTFATLWHRDQERLQAMAALCRTWGGRLVVVAWPQHKQPEWDHMVIAGVQQLAEQHNIIGLVDLDTALSKYPDEQLRIPGDGHPSASAHAGTGTYLASAIDGLLSDRK